MSQLLVSYSNSDDSADEFDLIQTHISPSTSKASPILRLILMTSSIKLKRLGVHQFRFRSNRIAVPGSESIEIVESNIEPIGISGIEKRIELESKLRGPGIGETESKESNVSSILFPRMSLSAHKKTREQESKTNSVPVFPIPVPQSFGSSSILFSILPIRIDSIFRLHDSIRFL